MRNPFKSYKPYSHLLKHDIIIWERFLDSKFNTYNDFLYDIRVGNGRDPGPLYADNIRKMAIQLSQRRIDAVSIAPDHTALFEITRTAGIKAFGQLKVYPILYSIDHPTHPPIRPILVAERLGTDVESSFTPSSITVLLFPDILTS